MTNEKLATIRQKIKRAKKHFADLEAERDRFFRDNDPYEIATYEDSQTGEHVFQVVRLDPVSPEIALIAGDVIHNTRAALDHLIWQLVLSNSKQPDINTAFPIFNQPTDCVASNAGQIQGLSQIAKEKIRDAEPYKGGKGNLFWILHKLDIADKHHALLTGTVCLNHSLLGHGSSRSSPGTHSEVYTFGGGLKRIGEPLKTGDILLILAEGHPYKNVQFSFDIGISDPTIGDSYQLLLLCRMLIAHADRLIGKCESELV